MRKVQTRNFITFSTGQALGDFTAVEDLSFNVRSGRVFAFSAECAGKTTTIRMIVGITAPDEGPSNFRQACLGEVQNRIGYLPEERGPLQKMRVAASFAILPSSRALRRLCRKS